MTLFDSLDYQRINNIVFQTENPYCGYKHDKTYGKYRFAYINTKFLDTTHPDSQILHQYFKRSFDVALYATIQLGIPKIYWPSFQHSSLRVLEYPPGAQMYMQHTDLSMLTLICYRNMFDTFKYENNNEMKLTKEVNPHIYFSEMAEVINPNFKALSHVVKPDLQNRSQYSLIFFAIPDHDATLPNGENVKNWIGKRQAKKIEDIKKFNTERLKAENQ